MDLSGFPAKREVLRWSRELRVKVRWKNKAQSYHIYILEMKAVCVVMWHFQEL